jgi:hypothetical protein
LALAKTGGAPIPNTVDQRRLGAEFTARGFGLGSDGVFSFFFFFFLIAAGAKFVYGDWGTTWNVGCFLVALAFGNAHLDVGYSCRVLMASGVAPKDACIFHRSSDA